MSDQTVAPCARNIVEPEGFATAELGEISPKLKSLSPTDVVNWLRYLAKCKQRLSEVSAGRNQDTLLFQAHVMREAARHLEALNR